jgi:signal transduction histidine kinase/class 3 adenylate cyclase
MNLVNAFQITAYNRKLLLIVCACFGLLSTAIVQAQDLASYYGGGYRPAFEYVIDKQGDATLDEIQRLSSDKFLAGGQKGVTLNFMKGAVWLRLHPLKSPDPDAKLLLQFADPLLDDIRVYQKITGGGWEESRLGDHPVNTPDALDAISPVLQINPLMAQTTSIYVRIQSKSSMLVELRLLTSEQFFQTSMISFLFYGAMFGIMMAMCLYNLFLFVSLRDYNYLLYVFSITTTALFLASLSGHAQRWLWPDYRMYTEEIFLVIVAGTLMSGLAFCTRFLEAKIYAPTLHKIIIGLFVLAGLTIPLTFMTSFQFSVNLTGAISGTAGTVGLITAAVCLARGQRSARFYLVAWTGYCIGTVLTAARQHGLVDNEFYAIHGMEIGAVLETILISFALSDRYNQLRIGREKAQHEVAESLRRMDKLKDEFLANTSHELRTPLQGIIGLAESMVAGATGKLGDAAKKNLSMIASSGQRLASLVDDILDFSKMKNRELVLNKRPIDLHVIVDLVLRLSAPLASAKSLQLVNSIDNKVPQVLGDQDRLQQILHNLVGNAVKFTEAGSVIVSAVDDGEQVRLLVTDTGIGIAPEDQERIFESFEQVEDSATRIHGGTGLGLAVTRNLVNLHGSNIDLASAPGEGSTFSFTLPVATEGLLESLKITPIEAVAQRSEVVAAPKAANVEVIELEYTRSSGKLDADNRIRILVVDDEPINRQVMENHLTLQDYEVLQVENGMKALELLSGGEKVDLILLDVMMPMLSGFEVCREIRKQHLATQLPVIMVTARTQMEDLQFGLQVGANDYITKPFSKGELLARIETHLNLAKINAAYSHYVPHEFLRYLNRDSIIDVRLGDNVEMEAAVFVSDVRGFTTLSETMTPDESFTFINDYFASAAPPIQKHGGFIICYTGDSVMAVFPGGAEQALAATRDTMAGLTAFNAKRESDGESPIRIGVGLHFGSLRLGIVGEHQRRQGDIFSDAVNVANRIEGMCKPFGRTVLVSAAFLEALPNPDEDLPQRRDLGEVPLRGRFEPLVLFAATEFDIHDGANVSQNAHE